MQQQRRVKRKVMISSSYIGTRSEVTLLACFPVIHLLDWQQTQDPLMQNSYWFTGLPIANIYKRNACLDIRGLLV